MFESSPITGSDFYDFVSSVFLVDGVVDEIVSVLALLNGDFASSCLIGSAFLWIDALPTPEGCLTLKFSCSLLGVVGSTFSSEGFFCIVVAGSLSRFS